MYSKLRFLIPILLPALVCGLAVSAAPTLSADEILSRMDRMEGVNDMTCQLRMVVTSKSGQTQIRNMTMYTKGKADGTQFVFVKVDLPALIKGTSMLSITRPKQAGETWLYLPALGKPKRITASESGGSFMGSDFSYQDMGTVRTEDYTSKLLRTEKLDGDEVYVIESVPRTEEIRKASGFSRQIWWIRTSNFTRAKAEFYDQSKKVAKVQLSSKPVEVKTGAWFNTLMEMSNKGLGSKTEVQFSNVRVNTGVKDEFFVVENMKE
mgnify:FL=1